MGPLRLGSGLRAQAALQQAARTQPFGADAGQLRSAFAADTLGAIGAFPLGFASPIPRTKQAKGYSLADGGDVCPT